MSQIKNDKKQFDKKLGKIVKKQMRINDFKVKEIAYVLDESSHTIDRHLRGETPIKIHDLPILKKKLGLTNDMIDSCDGKKE